MFVTIRRGIVGGANLFIVFIGNGIGNGKWEQEWDVVMGFRRKVFVEEIQNIKDSHSSKGAENDQEYIMGLKEVLLSLKGYEAGFPVILKLAITLGVSSTCEKSFSCVRHVKSFLRSTMTTDRLSGLAILSTVCKIY